MIGPFRDKWRFLSNFWPCHVKLDGKTYVSVEHAYQAAKTNDQQERAMIAVALTPGQAKRRGRKVKLRLDWPAVRVGIMRDLVRQKFANDDYLTKKLLATGDEELVEVNEWGDRFWGQSPAGHGANKLGEILMKVRILLREQKVGHELC